MRDFSDFRFQINNYFEYNRRGLVLRYLALGQEPWNDLRRSKYHLISRENRRLVGDWNVLYGTRHHTEIIKVQEKFRRSFGPARRRGTGGKSNLTAGMGTSLFFTWVFILPTYPRVSR